MSRKKRTLDGKLRPAVRRARAKRARARRRAWLANFRPGDRDRFFNNIELEKAIWLKAFAAEMKLERADAAAVLERMGEELRWRKLRTIDRTVVGIAPAKGPQTKAAL